MRCYSTISKEKERYRVMNRKKGHLFSLTYLNLGVSELHKYDGREMAHSFSSQILSERRVLYELASWTYKHKIKSILSRYLGHTTSKSSAIYWLQTKSRFASSFSVLKKGKLLKMKFTKLYRTALKIKFSIRVSSVNVIKSVVSCEFGHIYWRNP